MPRLLMKAAYIISTLVLTLNPCQAAASTVQWGLDSIQQIGGYPTEIMGKPRVSTSPYGKAIIFNGNKERLLVAGNPLGDASEFTLELLLKPANAFPDNAEPRLLHIEATDKKDRRITLELRLTKTRQWYLDAFLKSESSQAVLADPSLLHPVDKWAHVAITYRKGIFTSYVNGKTELTGEVTYLPVGEKARTSLGARMNKVYWYKGSLGSVAASPSALEASNFVLLPLIKKR